MVFVDLLRMQRLGATFAIALVAVNATVCAAATPAPSPVATASAGACSEPAEIDGPEAFAHVIEARRTLAFFRYAENIAPDGRDAVVRRAAVPISADATDAFGRGLANACDATEVDYRTARLVYMVSKRWPDENALDLQGAARYAVAALYLGDRVPAPIRDAALAVFGTSLSALDALVAQAGTLPSPSPASSPSAPCERDIDAKTTLAVTPDYPLAARSAGVTGTIRLVVALDARGYVESIQLYNAKLQPADPSQNDLIAAAVVAAGSSNYEPEFARCKPVRGKFIFRASFARTP